MAGEITEINQVIQGLRILQKYDPQASVEAVESEHLLVQLNIDARPVAEDDVRDLRMMGWEPPTSSHPYWAWD